MPKRERNFIWTTHSYYECPIWEVDPVEGISNVEGDKVVVCDGIAYHSSYLKKLQNKEPDDLEKSNQVIINNWKKKMMQEQITSHYL